MSVDLAILTAVRAHAGQGYGRGTYMEHVIDVTSRVLGQDEDVVVAAILHDTVKDTEITLEEIGALFARCYVGERPQHRDRFELRKSFLDDLTPKEKWALVEAARRAGRAAPATQPVLLEPPRRADRWRP